MNLTVKKGSTGRIARVHVTCGGTGRAGLTHDAAGAAAYFVREGDERPTPIPLVAADGRRHVPGGFREIDPQAMPGLYEIHLPDDVFAGPGPTAVVMLRLPGADPAVIHVEVVGYDPSDGQRLGLECLSQESRHACLSSAFAEVIPSIIERFHAQSP